MTAHSITDPIGAPTLLQSQTQSKAYLRFPQVFRKARDYDLSPSVFSSAFSSSKSSAETTSVSKLGFVGWYLGMLQHRPILTKSVTAALIYTAADLSSQTLAKSSFSESYDAVRTLRMAGYGMLVLGPSMHFWFNFMSRVFPKRDIFSTLKKMAMGQTLYGPAMTVVFFSLNACLQAISEQWIFVSVDHLYDIHGRPGESRHNFLAELTTCLHNRSWKLLVMPLHSKASGCLRRNANVTSKAEPWLKRKL
ncbi:Peroxisomal membrane 22 kDa Mpv17/PMP22 family protein [Prunus dulcis]|uniref:Peroxisomal membrane 22 kDa Mpv17/PMP22 family protein n=1 Tax=Prunus dulcis TaxID=3755 RepID=A0A4Y1S076_PRUDU|nr:Peroxisomal membrane 22 kDa Mpv17/PMP22 family protein [Prunus dulcis]